MEDELGLSNAQFIMIMEMEERIKKLKSEGKSYIEIRNTIKEEYYLPEHWCVDDKRKREEAIGVALVVYAMNDE